MTADELLLMRRPWAGRHELVDGDLVLLPPGGARRGNIGATISSDLSTYIREHGLGTCVTSRAGFVLRKEPDTVRAATFAFVRRGRYEGAEGFFPGAPDLAVEIFDWNNDYPVEIATRARDWMLAGTRMLIVIEPEPQTATMWTEAGAQVLTIDDTLSGADVVPGWSLPLRDLFAD